MAYHDFV
jgi:hypothetical protein